MVKTFLLAVVLFVSSIAYASDSPPTRGLHGAEHALLEVKGNITTEKSQADVQRDAEADKTKSIIDETMLKYTERTVLITGVVAFIALVQMFLFMWQLRLMRQSSDIATSAANAAKASAEVAMNTFVMLERPWIFLEKYRVVRREGAPIQPSLLNNFFISFQFKNNGRSPAFITDLAFNIIETSKLPAVPDYSLCVTKLTCPATLAAGKMFESSQVGPSPGKDVQYTIFGKLTYRDMAGVEHHTGFAVDVSPNLLAASTNKNGIYDSHD
jgi:hypothetical protein